MNLTTLSLAARQILLCRYPAWYLYSTYHLFDFDLSYGKKEFSSQKVDKIRQLAKKMGIYEHFSCYQDLDTNGASRKTFFGSAIYINPTYMKHQFINAHELAHLKNYDSLKVSLFSVTAATVGIFLSRSKYRKFELPFIIYALAQKIALHWYIETKADKESCKFIEPSVMAKAIKVYKATAKENREKLSLLPTYRQILNRIGNLFFDLHPPAEWRMNAFVRHYEKWVKEHPMIQLIIQNESVKGETKIQLSDKTVSELRNLIANSSRKYHLLHSQKIIINLSESSSFIFFDRNEKNSKFRSTYQIPNDVFEEIAFDQKYFDNKELIEKKLLVHVKEILSRPSTLYVKLKDFNNQRAKVYEYAQTEFPKYQYVCDTISDNQKTYLRFDKIANKKAMCM